MNLLVNWSKFKLKCSFVDTKFATTENKFQPNILFHGSSIIITVAHIAFMRSVLEKVEMSRKIA